MKRRDFFKASLAASTLATGLGATSLKAAAAEGAGMPQEYYELRLYRLKSAAEQAPLEQFLAQAAIPALNRLGSQTVGAFIEKSPAQAQDANAVYVLIPYATLEAFSSLPGRLAADEAFQKAGAAHLQRPKSNPAFERIDSWLLLAFAGMPRLKVPAYSPKAKSRLFELRTYESHSEAKALKKIQMFNSGEIEVMHEVGLAPVFYGQGLAGAKLPHLTYMTSGENEELHKQHWDAFGKHPVWNKLKNAPEYADTVSTITKRMLTPLDCSQL